MKERRRKQRYVENMRASCIYIFTSVDNCRNVKFVIFIRGGKGKSVRSGCLSRVSVECGRSRDASRSATNISKIVGFFIIAEYERTASRTNYFHIFINPTSSLRNGISLLNLSTPFLASSDLRNNTRSRIRRLPSAFQRETRATSTTNNSTNGMAKSYL